MIVRKPLNDKNNEVSDLTCTSKDFFKAHKFKMLRVDRNIRFQKSPLEQNKKKLRHVMDNASTTSTQIYAKRISKRVPLFLTVDVVRCF